MLGWECGACTFTNKDMLRHDCKMCMTERPLRYAIVADAATARTTTVNHREQAHLVDLAAPDVPAAVAEQTPAVAEEAPAAPDNHACAATVARVVGTMVDIVWTSAEDRGRSCTHHTCCGHQITKGSGVVCVV